MFKRINHPYLLILLGLLLGVIIGGTLFSDSSMADRNETDISAQAEMEYTCSMHPQIRQDGPGLCPICGMELIPMENNADEIDPNRIRMSPTALQLASVRTTPARLAQQGASVVVDGKIYPDERRVYAQTAHIPGRIEALGVDYTGAFVKKGEVIAQIYSPELITAQQEIIEAKKVMRQQPELYQATINRLKNWKFTPAQIAQVLQSNQAIVSFPILADQSGYVSHKHIRVGDHVREGQQLYEIQDLNKVWALFDVFEQQLSQVAVGDTVKFQVAALQGKIYTGVIRYLDPILGKNSRALKARVEIDNSENLLKPEMFVRGTLNSQSSMEELSVILPKSAVLWTGKRSVVYVKETDEQGIFFRMREVEIGVDFGADYEILAGIEVGEEVASAGAFSIDAAAQLAGKNSMMQDMHPKEQNSPSQKSVQWPVKLINLSPAYRQVFDQMLANYLELKDALTQDNYEEAKAGALAFVEASKRFIANETDERLAEHQSLLQEALTHIHHTTQIDDLRAEFLVLSNGMIALLKSYGLPSGKAYIQYCPMANQNAGGFWISREEQIQNPYFGAAMLMCGNVEETIELN